MHTYMQQHAVIMFKKQHKTRFCWLVMLNYIQIHIEMKTVGDGDEL